MTDKKLIEKIAHWRKHDFGACACLGNCKRCGYHMCHGCLCFVLDELESRADKRQKLLAEISELVDKMPAFTMTNPHNNHPANAYKLIDKVELRAKLAEMGEGNDAR